MDRPRSGHHNYSFFSLHSSVFSFSDGFARIAHEPVSSLVPGVKENQLRLNLPARTCIVLAPEG